MVKWIKKLFGKKSDKTEKNILEGMVKIMIEATDEQRRQIAYQSNNWIWPRLMQRFQPLEWDDLTDNEKHLNARHRLLWEVIPYFVSDFDLLKYGCPTVREEDVLLHFNLWR